MGAARALVAFAVALQACCCFAQTAAPYFERVLARDLPGTRVLALAEDHWGAIWAGTSNGVGRIIGDQVRVWRQVAADSASISANEVRCIDASDSTRIWLGTVRGICSIDPITGVVQRHALRLDGLAHGPEPEVWQLVRGNRDVLWVSFSFGLVCYHIDEQRWTWPSVEQSHYPGEPFKGVPYAMAWDGARRVLWAGTKNGLYRIPESAAQEKKVRDRLDPYLLGTHVSSLNLDAAGRVWMNDVERFAVSVLDLNSEELRQLDLPEGMDDGNINRGILADSQGRLWLAGNDDVLYQRDPRTQEWLAITHEARYRWTPSNTTVNAMLEARNGVLWFGTEEGLLRVLPGHDTQQLVAAWDSPRAINRMRAQQGSILLATNGIGVVRYQASTRRFTDTIAAARLRSGAVQPGHLEDMVTDIETVGDRLLLGTKSGARYWPEGNAQSTEHGALPPDSKPSYKYVTRVGVDSRSTIWVLTYHHGLWLQEADERAPRQVLFDGSARRNDERIATMAVHPTGGVVCGTSGGTLLRLNEHGNVIRSAIADSSAWSTISALAVGSDDRVWVGQDLGRLQMLDADLKAMRAWDAMIGLAGGQILAIEPTADGGAWVLSDGGISFIDARGDAKPMALLEHWGRPTSILLEPEGALLVACSKALVRLRDGLNQRQQERLRPAIVAVKSAGAQLAVHPFRNALEVPYDRRSLSIRVSCLEAAVPERALLRYRLNPDRPWVELGLERAIDLPELREGDYAIEVALLSGETPSALLNLTILPPWYRSAAAIIGIIVLAAIVLILTARSWLKRKLRVERERSAREKALLEERVRIAHDLHDDLGSSLAMIAMEGELARMDEGADARDALKRVSDGAREVTDNMRRIVWALGSGQDSLGDLAAYMRSSAAELLERADLRLEAGIEIENPDLRLTADQRRHLLLIVKELLLNVVKHAEARCVTLRMTQQNGTLYILLDDDGRGFDTALRMGSGTGTTSVQERVVALKGTLEFSSARSEGTRVRILIPLNPATV